MLQVSRVPFPDRNNQTREVAEIDNDIQETGCVIVSLFAMFRVSDLQQSTTFHLLSNGCTDACCQMGWSSEA